MEIPDWVVDLAGVVAAAAAAGGLFFAGWQVSLTRKATGVQLLLQVDDMLQRYDEKFENIADGVLTGDEFEVRRMMGAMERLNLLLDSRLVEPRIVRDLHGWRLEKLLNNAKVRARLEKHPDGWRQLTELSERLQSVDS